jgi:hypothetical protein
MGDRREMHPCHRPNAPRSNCAMRQDELDALDAPDRKAPVAPWKRARRERSLKPLFRSHARWPGGGEIGRTGGSALAPIRNFSWFARGSHDQLGAGVETAHLGRGNPTAAKMRQRCASRAPVRGAARVGREPLAFVARRKLDNRHYQDVGRALEESKVVRAGLLLRPARDLKPGKSPAGSWQDW